MKKIFYPIFFVAATCGGCTKYLEAVPDKSLVVASSIQDMYALLDNNGDINRFTMGLGEASADNYYVLPGDYNNFSNENKNTYTWGDELFFSNTSTNEWLALYKIVYDANLVLETLAKVERTEQNKADWDNLKGSSLFIRARAMHFLVTDFANAYDSTTAATELGVPIRLSTDFNLPDVRSNNEESYQRIIADLREAIPLLPVNAQHVMRPSRTAAYALMARHYLSMRKYPQAYAYADSSLTLNNTLMDYNGGTGVNGPTAAAPFAMFNPEVLYHAGCIYVPLYSLYAKVDSTLYRSYDNNDLRKILFFSSNADGSVSFKGNYTDQVTLFLGLATDEMYLTRAEAAARLGNVNIAMNDLNTLLKKRWKNTVTYPTITATTSADATAKILVERRKELLMRNIRWEDIKRLNKEGAGISLQRNIAGQNYTLPANDKRFALPLPAAIIQLSGMPQNPR